MSKYYRLSEIEQFDIYTTALKDQERFRREIISYRSVLATLSADTHVSKLHFSHPIEDRYCDHDGLIVSAGTSYKIEIKTRWRTNCDYKECWLDWDKVEKLTGETALHIAYIVPLGQLFIWDMSDHTGGRCRRSMRRGPEDVYVYLKKGAQIIDVIGKKKA